MTRSRRRLLASIAVFGSAGCLSAASDRSPTPTRTSSTPEKATDPGDDGGDAPGGEVPSGGASLPTQSELRRVAARDGIPAITAPKFGADWSAFEASLSPEDRVIGVERNGEARAYPLAILNWHEIVNDKFDGPLLVSYCPLCGSGVVASRVVGADERTLTFGVSGLLFEDNLVMYDVQTESLWSQVLAECIRGEYAGTRLELLPAATTTWGEWRESNPDTQVLLPPPASETIVGDVYRDYTENPYAHYRNASQAGLGGGDPVDGRLHPKTTVLGITHGGVARAYPLGRVSAAGVINDTVGGLPVVVTTTPGDSLVAYVRRVDGETLTFEAEGEFLAGGDSRWRPATGEAIDGPHEGTQLARANDRSPMFWFAWSDFYPETEVWER